MTFLTKSSGTLLSHGESPNILDRRFESHSFLTERQTQVDGLVGGFVQRALDWRSLAAMTAGGLAYRVGRLGLAGSGNILKALSVGAGLSAEVSAFELTHRSLMKSEIPNLWRWSGRDGLAQGFLHSFLAFGSLKGAGHLASGENLLSRHLLQDSALVFSQNASAVLGFGSRPLGSLAEQFLHAEVTNLQAGAGMALAQGFSPGMQALERGMNSSMRSQIPPTPLFQRGVRGDFVPAVAEGPALPPWFAMSGPKDREAGPKLPASTGATFSGVKRKEAQRILEAAEAKGRGPQGLGPALELSKKLLKAYPELSAHVQGFVDRGMNKFLRSANSDLFLVGAALLGRTLSSRKDLSSLSVPALILAKRLSPSLPMRGGVASVLKDVVRKMSVSNRLDFVEEVLRIHAANPRDAFEVIKEVIPALETRDERMSAVQLTLRRFEERSGSPPSENLKEALESLVGPPPSPPPKVKSRRKKTPKNK